MTIITAPVQKPTNGKPSAEETAVLAAVKTVLNPEQNKTEVIKPVLQIEPEKPVIPAAEPNWSRPAQSWNASRFPQMISTARCG